MNELDLEHEIEYYAFKHLKVKEEAFKILSLLNDTKKIDGYEHLKFLHIEDEYAIFQGATYCHCRGHLNYKYEFKASLIYNSYERNEFLKNQNIK